MEEVLREQVFQAVVRFLRSEALPASANVLQFEAHQRTPALAEPRVIQEAKKAQHLASTGADDVMAQDDRDQLCCCGRLSMVSAERAGREAIELDPFLVGSAVLFGVREALTLELSAERLLRALDDASAVRKRRRRFFVADSDQDGPAPRHLSVSPAERRMRSQHGAGEAEASATGAASAHRGPALSRGALRTAVILEPVSEADTTNGTHLEHRRSVGQEKRQQSRREGSSRHCHSLDNDSLGNETDQRVSVAGGVDGVHGEPRRSEQNASEPALRANSGYQYVDTRASFDGSAASYEMPMTRQDQQYSARGGRSHQVACDRTDQYARTPEQGCTDDQAGAVPAMAQPVHSMTRPPPSDRNCASVSPQRSSPCPSHTESAVTGADRAPMSVRQSDTRPQGRVRQRDDEDATEQPWPQRPQMQQHPSTQDNDETRVSTGVQLGVSRRALPQQQSPDASSSRSNSPAANGQQRILPNSSAASAVDCVGALHVVTDRLDTMAGRNEHVQRADVLDRGIIDATVTRIPRNSPSLRSEFDMEKLHKLRTLDVDAFLTNKVYTGMRDER
ncbi:hypothetical protein CCYA_CCYA07G2132 [Cyanidiococcus yangmingshanensis]|nr:hypothetical protein CCYA_CCYA07G2132 [Cyanidiococcus yangmingshanensis]